MKSLLKNFTQRLRRYYPQFKSWHFWIVQIMVVVISAAHLAMEHAGYFEQLGRLYFVPISLLVVPVVYAAIKFGFIGSVSTAIWVVLISVPNFVFGHAGFERLGEMFEMGILVVIAFLIGQKVDNEVRARLQTEAADVAVRVSEKKYRSLFDSSPMSIFVMDKDDNVVDANPAAGILFGKSPAALKGTDVSMIEMKSDPQSPASFRGDKWWEADLVIRPKDGSEIYLKPTRTQIIDGQGNDGTLIILRDVTEEYHRQAGLKAYAGHMIRVQEEERLYIARELHDETIQTLSLLCRELHSIDITDGNMPPSVVEKLRKSTDISEQVVKGLRDFTKALRPPALDDLGMIASIRRLLLDFMDRTKIKGQLEIVGEERRLSRDVEVGIFRIAQEALWNVEHHAKADKVVISIIFAVDEVRLRVSDDGVGFHVPPVLEGLSASGKLGLLGMKERAELFNGKLEIQSSSAVGTTIAVSIPKPAYADKVAERL